MWYKEIKTGPVPLKYHTKTKMPNKGTLSLMLNPKDNIIPIHLSAIKRKYLRG